MLYSKFGICKDEYKSVKSGYLPSLDLNGKYGIAEKKHKV